MATKKTTKKKQAPVAPAAPASRKDIVVAALRASLAADLAAVLAAAHAAHAAATHPEAKPENDKDTRALEAGYLAGAQSARAAELQRTVADLERAPTSAFTLLSVRETIASRVVDSQLLLAPAGGGQKLVIEGETVAVVTPKSPLGAALAGQHAGAVVDVEMGARVRTFEIRDAS
ncbi:MAG: transcription elongation factor GreAB [Deltaproteobacteria bacterium]|nr:transcription elongation factor GreAB [Deltaproteobacteria bacterium]